MRMPLYLKVRAGRDSGTARHMKKTGVWSPYVTPPPYYSPKVARNARKLSRATYIVWHTQSTKRRASMRWLAGYLHRRRWNGCNDTSQQYGVA